ncbi:RNase H domain-containing protein [Trichonephila clavipes]|nr:RNase H domain-containing protein [Trichonephila clavipes]
MYGQSSCCQLSVARTMYGQSSCCQLSVARTMYGQSSCCQLSGARRMIILRCVFRPLQPVCYQDLKTSIQHYIHHIWQDTWDQQVINKLHSIHLSTAHWAAVPVRRQGVSLTRLRIGHTRLTHRHLLQGESRPFEFGLAIHQNDHQARRRFVEWAQNEIAVVPDFHKRILFSDEAHFWLNGYVNKQNCRIWSEANPQVYVETPLHPEKLTVWCALSAGGILLQKR